MLQKIPTGSSLIIEQYRDKDYVILYDSFTTNADDILNLRKEDEDFLVRDINNIDKDNTVFLLIMTYLLLKEKEISYETFGEKDYFKEFYEDNKDKLPELTKKAIKTTLFGVNNKLSWWFLMAIDYIRSGIIFVDLDAVYEGRNKLLAVNKQQKIADFAELQIQIPLYRTIPNESDLEAQEIDAITQWFNETDYIELQAIRGTISRDSEKYTKYLNEYNEKLFRYKEIKNKG